MSSVDEGKTWLPFLLRLLLQTIVQDDLKQAAIGQCIVQAARPRSVISPILFGLGIELDLKMRSKWLVNHLSRLGFSITYDEIVRFRQCAMPSTNEPPPLHLFPTSFTQWVGDNVDHNTATLDGRGTFHGMGLIAISTHSSNAINPMQEEAITRMKRVNVKDATKDHGRGAPLNQSARRRRAPPPGGSARGTARAPWGR